MMSEARHGARKTREGVVVSDEMERTVVVAVERKVPHPVYRRIIKRTTKFMAHDEDKSCAVGDRVKIMETRPLSARKRWRVVQVLEKAK